MTCVTLPQSGSGRKEQTKSKADKEAARTPVRSACSCSIEKPPMAGQGRSPALSWGAKGAILYGREWPL